MVPGIYSEQSITRRVNRENVLMLGGGRALLMQLAHPKVAAGVDDHSDFRVDPLRRLRRTVKLTMAIIFGTQEDAVSAARTVNQAHARVKGPDYRALDPDLLLWVHTTLVDSTLVTYETFVRSLGPCERDQFYQESKITGELLGIPTSKFPKTHSDLILYMGKLIARGTVKVDDRARSLAKLVLRPPVRLLGLAMVPMDVVTAGLLPGPIREQYGLKWGRGEQRLWRMATKAVPKVVRLTPPLLRVWPLPGHNVKLEAALRTHG
jgi:uncharacterized protein (DUF2236 family)